MNDRHLYRAKRKDSGEWIEGYYAVIGEKTVIIEKEREEFYDVEGEKKSHGNKIVEVDQSTICQCTGLRDKNGNLIWENDVVSFQFDNDDCPFPNKDTRKRIGKVFFSDFRASWSIAMGKNGSKSLNNDLWKYVQNGNRVEVIGSAIDNPKLLEVEE